MIILFQILRVHSEWIPIKNSIKIELAEFYWEKKIASQISFQWEGAGRHELLAVPSISDKNVCEFFIWNINELNFNRIKKHLMNKLKKNRDVRSD